MSPSEVDKVNIPANAALHISQFPADMHEMLREIDDEGNGYLEADELAEVFSMYCAMKKANKEGAISIQTLPKELQPTLKVFDVDNDGSVAPLELARAAELYKQSRNQVQRLVKAVAILLIILLALVGTIVGLVAVVVEESKEQKVSVSGVTTAKGSSTVAATGSVQAQSTIFNALSFTTEQLEAITKLNFNNDAGILTYKIIGSFKHPDSLFVKFHASTGAVITITSEGLDVTDPLNNVRFQETPAQTSARRRRLLQMGGGGHGLLSMETYAVYNATEYDYLADSDLPEYESRMFGGWPDSDSDWDSDSDSDSDSDRHYYRPDPYANYDPLDTGFMPDPTVVTPGMGGPLPGMGKK